MSGTAPRLEASLPADSWPKGRSPLAHLLHALNQPLTGLQCALELAAASPRPSAYSVGTLREALELTARMRTLVEATRELVTLQDEESEKNDLFPLDALLRETVEDLRPVAETRGIDMAVSVDTGLMVQADRGHVNALTFRLLESVLSLALEESPLRLTGRREGDRATFLVSWIPAAPAEHSPFSRPELGLLISHAAWEREGGEWASTQEESSRTCTLRLSLAAAAARRQNAVSEI